LVARILKVGESTGALDTSFNQLSYVYDRESKELTEKLEQSLGPIMTVIVGLIMMWVVISVIGPIYDLVFGFSGGLQ
jgi:type IV pilus assembly protein PilC